MVKAECCHVLLVHPNFQRVLNLPYWLKIHSDGSVAIGQFLKSSDFA